MSSEGVYSAAIHKRNHHQYHISSFTFNRPCKFARSVMGPLRTGRRMGNREPEGGARASVGRTVSLTDARATCMRASGRSAAWWLRAAAPERNLSSSSNDMDTSGHLIYPDPGEGLKRRRSQHVLIKRERRRHESSSTSASRVGIPLPKSILPANHPDSLCAIFRPACEWAITPVSMWSAPACQILRDRWCSCFGHGRKGYRAGLMI